MIKFYCLTPQATHLKLNEDWLKNPGLAYEKMTFSEITVHDFELMLSLSDNSFRDILRDTPENIAFIKKINNSNMKLHDAINLILEKPCRLRNPIPLDDKHCVTGFNSDELRIFIPREKRNARLEMMGFNACGGSLWVS